MPHEMMSVKKEIERLRVELERRVAERTEDLAFLNTLAALANSDADLPMILRDSISLALEATGAVGGSLGLFEEETGALVSMTTVGSFPDSQGLGLQNGGPGIVPRTVETRGVTIEGKELAIVTVPLEARSKPLGTLWLVYNAPFTLSMEKANLLQSVGLHLGVTVQNAQLVGNLLQAREETEKVLRDLHEANRRSREISLTDDLTGLPNYRHLIQRLGEEVERIKRYGQTFALAIMDLDDFKEINDTYGHEAGNEMLRRVGRVLQSSLRLSDLPARYGGDEFAIILLSTGEEALATCDRIRHALEALPSLRGKPMTVSIGLVFCPDDADNSDQLLVLADRAMYKAKALGRNRVITYRDMVVD